MKTVSVRTKVLVAAVFGLAAGLVVGRLLEWQLAPLAAWDVAAALYVFWVWKRVWSLDPKTTAEHALREDPGRAAADVLLLGASLASLVAVGFVLAKASGTQGIGRLFLAGFGVVSVIVSWSLVHTIFTLKYAELYYGDKPGGIDFNGPTLPRYQDFAYMAFTIGMTFQVSDTSLQNSAMRATALRHAWLSYLFGTVIVATTINLIAGLRR